MGVASAAGVGRRQVWTGSLQWFVGFFCVVLGAMVLVVPHKFTTLGSILLQPFFSFWGIVFILAGAGLVAAAALAVARWARIAVHLIAAAVLLLVAAGFATHGLLVGAANYGILGAGVAVAAFLPESRAGRPLDLFSFLMGVLAALIGVILLVRPDALGPRFVALARVALPWYGVFFLGSGLALMIANLRPKVSFQAEVAAHALVAAAFAGVAIPSMPLRGSWSGLVYFVGLGLALALLPWFGPRMRQADPSSLRLRLAVTLAAAVAVTTIVVVTLATAQEQHLVMGDRLDAEQTAAKGLATNVGDFIRLHQAAVAALAAHPDLIGMTPSERTTLLMGFASAYPDVLSFAVYDAGGHPIVRSDDLTPVRGDQIPVFSDARSTLTSQMVVGVSPLTGRPLLTLVSPLHGPAGFAGVAIATLPVSRLADLLSRAPLGPEGRVYLINDIGDVIAHHGPPQDPPVSIAPQPPVAAMLNSKDLSGALTYPSSSGSRLAGFARVPGISVCSTPCTGPIGWAVVSEDAAGVALANVDNERALAFGLLLLAIAVAGLFGVVAGRTFTRPLVSLAAAMGQYTSTGGEAPLPRSTTSEVARLVTGFGEMRDRITARTEERRRAEEALSRETALVRLMQDVAIAANEAGGSGEAFRPVLELICRSTGWAVGHVWLTSRGTDSLESSRIWHLDDPQRRLPFRQATEALTLSRGTGLPGRVLETGKPEWHRDMSGDPTGPRMLAIATAGLRAGIAIPVEAGGEVVAVMEFFSTEATDSDSDPVFLETIALAGAQVGRVLEREQRNREAVLLNELAELLQTSATVQEAYGVIEKLGQKFFPASAGVLFVMSPSKDLLEPACAWGPRPRTWRNIAPVECWALRLGQPHFTGRGAGISCAHLGDAQGISLCVPIAQHESLGMLQLEWEAPSGASGASDSLWEARERLAMAVARHIGPAIANLRLRETLRAQSIRDPLTGLFNRRYMEESLEREVHRAARRSSGMSVLMLDIDRFKLFNDTYGHEAGDAMLSAFGSLLLLETRKEDIACRYGGEEFVAILSDVTSEEALERAEQFRAAASALRVEHRGALLSSITVSVGVAVFPMHGTTGKALLREADAALYRAKQNGRARVELAV